jgi:NADP-dependent 3-hydroxy acid dehydrogenase YdfG
MLGGAMVSLQDRVQSGDVTELAGKAIVITGGTTGIGRATAKLLAGEGAKVLIFGRHQPELDAALREIGGGNGQVHGLTADQSRKEDIERVFADADRHIGGCDILINSAAVGLGSFLETKYEDWLYEIQTNLVAYIACCRYAIDRMKKKGTGHIVNIGSMSADLREPTNDVYVATKAGIQGFTESLRKNINKENIRVTLIEPGAVNTPIQEKPEEEKRAKVERMEMLEPEEIAHCVKYVLVQPARCDVVAVQIRPLKQLI